MMEERVFGNRYDFIIKLEKCGKSYCFCILSLFKSEKRKSAITNLNFIISEIIDPILKKDLEESDLFIAKKQGQKLFDESVKLFRDKAWLYMLENELDEDRDLGGWNSSFDF